MTERVGVPSAVELEAEVPIWRKYPQTTRAILDLGSREAISIFADIAREQKSAQVTGDLREFLLRESSQRSVFGIRQALAAYFFEEYAYRLARSRVGLYLPGSIVLSPPQSARAFQIARPDKPTVIAHRGWAQAKGDLKNPDGIVLTRRRGKTLISGVCEYTLGTRNPNRLEPKKKKQTQHFRSGEVIKDILVRGERQQELWRYFQSLFPEMSAELGASLGNFRLIYVRPQRSMDDVFDSQLVDKSRTLYIYAPFTREQFGEVIDGLVEDTRSLLSKKPSVS